MSLQRPPNGPEEAHEGVEQGTQGVHQGKVGDEEAVVPAHREQGEQQHEEVGHEAWNGRRQKFEMKGGKSCCEVPDMILDLIVIISTRKMTNVAEDFHWNLVAKT